MYYTWGYDRFTYKDIDIKATLVNISKLAEISQTNEMNGDSTSCDPLSMPWQPMSEAWTGIRDTNTIL